jgi:hypothetical protein
MGSGMREKLDRYSPFHGHCTLVPDLVFGECCRKHDEDYERGSPAKRKKKSDLRLLRCMDRMAKKQKNMLYVIALLCISRVYYFGVRLFGRAFWKR